MVILILNLYALKPMRLLHQFWSMRNRNILLLLYGVMGMHHPRTGGFFLRVDEEKPASNITPNTANDLARRFMVFYRTVLHPFFQNDAGL